MLREGAHIEGAHRFEQGDVVLYGSSECLFWSETNGVATLYFADSEFPAPVSELTFTGKVNHDIASRARAEKK